MTNQVQERRKFYAIYLSRQPVAERARALNRIRNQAQRADMVDLIYQVKAKQLLVLPVNLLSCALNQLAEIDHKQFLAVSRYLKKFAGNYDGKIIKT